jgi:hypothetical protein
VDDYKKGFKMISADMNKVKKSMTPFAMIYMIVLIMQFPKFIREAILYDYSKRFTFVFSNVPGTRNPL